MAHPIEFRDAWIRVRRAEERRKRLQAQVVAFRTKHPHANEVVPDHYGKGNVRLVVQVRQRPPAKWGLLAGDVLTDLRTALDYAVYALAVSNTGQDPPPWADRLEFPICLVDTRWREALGRHKLEGLSADAVRYIELQQPYSPGNGEDTAALWVLERFVGINKHRFIHPCWAAVDDLRVEIGVEGLTIEDWVAHNIEGALNDGAVVGEFRVAPTAPGQAQLKVQVTLSTYVGFEPFPGYPSTDMLWALEGTVFTVSDILRHLESYL